MTTQQQKFERKIQRIKGPATRQPLPGSWRMRNNASKRSANWLSDDKWQVAGGDNPHIVIAGQYGKPETFTCDCGLPEKRQDHLCCHILAVMREM